MYIQLKQMSLNVQVMNVIINLVGKKKRYFDSISFLVKKTKRKRLLTFALKKNRPFVLLRLKRI